ncbi:hypothetical protein CDD80_858 [Ophiocordyceps camponoti-rufipedis]|uniref:Glutathione hydrolase n=1 Tax=Ophiocordyceps camponoti-rufipedis TaxID=2004952 RepID=A0A2C5XY41_9HYPO|nr:hypothetical protein CDD80_858 [Ophiocordyceps camponoti-rufipedis]
MTPRPMTWLVSLLAASLPLPSAAKATGNEGVPKLGAVASESAVCSRIGTQLLQSGGSAADAIIGTILCVGTVAMYHSGIGGGGFMTIRGPDGQFETVDFREVAPAAAFEDMFGNNSQASMVGGLASGVPGELRGLEYLHSKYGKLEWFQVVEPVVHLARFGFVVTEDLATRMASPDDASFLTEDPSWALDFAPRGRLLQQGEIMTRKRYADTLEAIALHGVDAFYSGPIAQATIAGLRARNGTMTMEDLANYTVVHREPIHLNYRGYKLTSCNAPSGGIVALSALNILSNYDSLGDPSQFNLSTHRLDEAIRFAYGQRTKLGDPSFVDVANLTASMVSPEHGAYLRSRISDLTTQELPYYDPEGLESLDTPGTSHMVAADKSGLAISLTTTVNLLFGSQVMIPETGIVMNDQMNDFSIPGVSNGFGYIPSPSNYIRPGKRPLSSISPIIAETPDGKLLFSLGAAGGSRITTATIQNTIHLLDRHMNMAEALRQPRLHDQLVPTMVTFEYAFDNSTVAYMKSLHHNVSWVPPGQSLAQGVRLLPNGTFEAAGEPRLVASGGFAV